MAAHSVWVKLAYFSFQSFRRGACVPAEPPIPDDAVQELLQLRLIATLGTTDAVGEILLTPIWYLYQDGRLYLPTSSSSRKARNVAARPDVTVLVDQRRPDLHRWASATGTASIMGGSQAARVNEQVRQRYLSDVGEEVYGQRIADYDDVTVVVTPRAWRSWTPGALATAAEEHGIPDTELASLFQPWD
jgi:PPOX class probable F420-dependent enzyme